jgi:hypothetical protein
MSMPSQQDRVIRVFISSTFRDMHAERDYLVKFVFPQLRRLCEARGVTWGEVDLRWGVTDEEAAEGKVLPICHNGDERSGLAFGHGHATYQKACANGIECVHSVTPARTG